MLNEVTEASGNQGGVGDRAAVHKGADSQEDGDGGFGIEQEGKPMIPGAPVGVDINDIKIEVRLA